MKVNNVARSDLQRLQNGYTPKGYVTVVQGQQTVQIPVSQVTIIPPTSGTAAVTPRASHPLKKARSGT